MSTIFFTGFPGFLGSELLPRVLVRRPDDVAVCLVQPKFAALARDRVSELLRRHELAPDRLRLVEGDIVAPDLGLGGEGSAASLLEDVVEIYHLAAVYDLEVKRGIAERVNVDGTRHVLTFAESCPALTRLHYVSTCYVSGRYPGTFMESDLELGQSFNNFYEETKFRAEVEVRRHMAAGLPTTIYRPAIVVGDSRTGATQKYDGPYFVLQWLLRQPRLAFLPTVGDLSAEFNVVPRDFVVDAIDYLSASPCSAGRTYQLADPAPATVAQIIEVLASATRRRVIRIRLPIGLAKFSLAHVPGVQRLLRIPPGAIDYFVHPTHYDTGWASSDLRGSGIDVPSFRDYARPLVEFEIAHKEIGAAAMA